MGAPWPCSCSLRSRACISALWLVRRTRTWDATAVHSLINMRSCVRFDLCTGEDSNCGGSRRSPCGTSHGPPVPSVCDRFHDWQSLLRVPNLSLSHSATGRHEASRNRSELGCRPRYHRHSCAISSPASLTGHGELCSNSLSAVSLARQV